MTTKNTPQEPPQQVRIKRTDLPAPDLEDPLKIIVQIQYQVGDLPPRFLYLNKKDWSDAKEKELIKADLKKRLETPGQIITL